MRYDPKQSVNVDYLGMANNPKYLTINVYFQSSGRFNFQWLFRSESDSDSNEIDFKGGKYESKCLQLDVFSFNCFLFIDYFSNQDVGEYFFRSNLIDNENVKIEIRSWVILPSLFRIF